MVEEKAVKAKPAEVEKIIVELGKKGETPAKIGLILRDKYGVPKAKLLDKKITEVLKKENVAYKEDLHIIKDKIANLKRHIAENKHDHSAGRSIAKQMWAVSKIEKNK